MLCGREQSHRGIERTKHRQQTNTWQPVSLRGSVWCSTCLSCRCLPTFFFRSSCSCSWNFKLRRQRRGIAYVCFFHCSYVGVKTQQKTNKQMSVEETIGQLKKKSPSTSAWNWNRLFSLICNKQPDGLLQDIHAATSETSFYFTYPPCVSPVFTLSWCPNTQEPLCLARLDLGDGFLSLFLVRMLFPMLGESPGAPTQVLSSGHPVALH